MTKVLLIFYVAELWVPLIFFNYVKDYTNEKTDLSFAHYTDFMERKHLETLG